MSDSDPDKSSLDNVASRSDLLWSALVLLLSIAAFLPAIRDSYVLDDRYHVLSLAPADGVIAWLKTAADPWWKTEHNTLWRPVTRMLHVLEKSLSRAAGYGDESTLFRCFSLALHALASWLTMKLGRSVGLGRAGAGFAGILMAIHPLRSEGVHQIVGQAEILSAIWMTLGMLVYLGHRSSQKGVVPLMLWQASFCALAIGSKENGVVYPVLILLVELGICRRRDSDRFEGLSFRHAQMLAVSLFLPVAIFLAGKWGVTGGLFPDRSLVRAHENPLAPMGLLERVPAVAGIFAHFLSKCVLPRNLSPDYSAESLPFGLGWRWPASWIGLALFAALACFAIWSFRRGGRTWALITGGLAAYGVTSNFLFPIGVSAAMRLWYFPLTAVALGAGALWRSIENLWQSRLPDRESPLRFVPRFGLAILVILLLSSTLDFATAWRNNIQFSERTLAQFPRNWRAHINLAVYAYDQKKFEDGLRWARGAAEIRPTDPKSWRMVELNAKELPGHETEAADARARQENSAADSTSHVD